MSYYQTLIREYLASMGRIGTDPRHVEAWMRCEHGTLDALGTAAFRAEVQIACECIDAASAADSEMIAASYGL